MKHYTSDSSNNVLRVMPPFNISNSNVHLIFKWYVNLPRLPLREYIPLDGIYLNINDRDKYAFVVMVFISGVIINIVQKCWCSISEDYCLSFTWNKGYMSKPSFPMHAGPILSYLKSAFLMSSRLTFIYKVLKLYKRCDEQRQKQKKHDTNQNAQSIRDSGKSSCSKIINGSNWKTRMK